MSDKHSKVFVKHAVDCYSSPKRLYIHYKHFKNKDCYYSTQPKGYFYNINKNKYFFYNGVRIEPYNWQNYFHKNNIISRKISNNKSIIYRGCHLNMALRTDIMKKVKLSINPKRAGLDGYILYQIFNIINIIPSEKKIIFTDDEIDKDNWKYSLDTDGYNNISNRNDSYDNLIPSKPHCIPTNNIIHKIPDYIMERLKNI